MNSNQIKTAAQVKLWKTILVAVACLLAAFPAMAQEPQTRITRTIDNSNLVKITGNVHPFTHVARDAGAADAAQPLRRIILVLGRSSEQEKDLQKLLLEQQSPGSSNFRKWLTPDEFGRRFGVSDADVQTVVGWLAANGFEVSRVANSKTFVEFNGTAGQVQQVFHTQMHRYSLKGKEYWANASDPEIPSALAPVVKGFASLHNFPYQFYSRPAGNYKRDPSGIVTPLLTTSNGYYGLGPGDFATIYNSLPLLSQGNDGAGQTIAIVGETNFNQDDVANFRSSFGLGVGNTQYLLDGPDPGITNQNEESEALLDVQWSSAVAPGATVKYVMSASTEVTQGVDLSALYIVENNLAGVMSESYGQCEANIGQGGNLFRLYLSEQAAAQGITVVVSTGDNGAAGCDPQGSAIIASNGLGINGLASTPFNVGVGGTDYNDAGNLPTYWSSSNTTISAGSYSLPFVSAQSYIPEKTWNDSCGTNAAPGSLNVCQGETAAFGGLTLWAGSGGRSSCGTMSGGSCSGYAKPSWQIASTPNDGVRDLPDVSFFAAGGETDSQSFYVICQSDALPSGAACVPDEHGSISFSGTGGTSAAAPSFAGVVALAMQKAGGRLGNINYLLYSVPKSNYNDVTTGTISMPCLGNSKDCSSKTSAIGVLVDSTGNPAYSTATGYDRATGLGTPNVTNLVDALAAAANSRSGTTTSLALNGGTASVSGTHGSPISISIDVANASGAGQGPAGDVALVSSSGVAIDSTSLANPLVAGTSGHSTASWSSPLFPGGNYTVSASYNGDEQNAPSQSSPVAVNITPESSMVFALIETCSGNNLTGIYSGSITLTYGDCYFARFDVADAETGTFLGFVSPVVTSKCTNGLASCATGSLSITDNGQPLDGGTWPLNPNSYTEDFAISLGGGTHTLKATYAGDASYGASSGTMTVTVNQASTTISQPTATPSTLAVGDSVVLVANVRTTTFGAAPTGTVTFFDNGTAMTGSLELVGSAGSGSNAASTLARFTTSFSTSGSHTVKAQYNGDANYSGSSVSPSLTITVAPATKIDPDVASPVASSSPALAGLPITLTTSIAPPAGSNRTIAPTGAVTFLENGTPLSGTVKYSTSGTTLTATLQHTFESTGVHSVSVQYAGDDNYNSSTSSTALALTVNSPIALTLDQSAVTSQGGSGTITLTVAAANGFTGTVNVSCTSGSSRATCTPQAASLAVTSGTNAMDTITFAVPAATAAMPVRAGSSYPITGSMLAGILFVFLPGLRRKRRYFAAFSLLALSLLLASCGGSSKGGGIPNPPPVTYSFTVHAKLATDSNVAASAQFTVTVR